jgi:putative FmdB family regulatory protein
MPIINYTCSDCGKKFAKIFVDTQHAPKMCPVCSSDRITSQGDAFVNDVNTFARLSCDSCETCDSCGTSANNSCLCK